MRRGALPAAMLAGVVLSFSACAKLGSNSHRAQTQTSTSEAGQPVVPANPRRYGGEENYFVNPSFEAHIAPWRAWRSNSVVQIARTTSRIGRASARVSAKSGAPYGIYDPNLVSLPAKGDRFVFSAWLRSGDRPKRIIALLQGGSPKGPIIHFALSSSIVTSRSWQRVSLEGRVKQSNITSIDVYFVVLNSIGAGDSFFLDGAKLFRQ